MDAWIRAALMAEDDSAQAIVLAHFRANVAAQASSDPAGANGSSGDKTSGRQVDVYDPRDVQLASQLTRELLKESLTTHG
jgi:hypothetical protein